MVFPERRRSGTWPSVHVAKIHCQEVKIKGKMYYRNFYYFRLFRLCLFGYVSA